MVIQMAISTRKGILVFVGIIEFSGENCPWQLPIVQSLSGGNRAFMIWPSTQSVVGVYKVISLLFKLLFGIFRGLGAKKLMLWVLFFP